MRLWITNAEKYPSLESLRSVSGNGNQVYGYHSSDESGVSIKYFDWFYRDWSSAYETGAVWGYWLENLDRINERNDKIIPAGTKIRVVLEVANENGEVVIKEEVVTMTEDLYQKALVR